MSILPSFNYQNVTCSPAEPRGETVADIPILPFTFSGSGADAIPSVWFKNCWNRNRHSRGGNLLQPELLHKCLLNLLIRLLKIGEKFLALRDHLQETAA